MKKRPSIQQSRWRASIEPQDQFVFDLDSSGFAAYGNQHGVNFNYHYKQKGFHPLFYFDGLTGDCLKAELRAGNVYTSRQVVRFVGPLVSRYESWVPGSLIVLRGDSGFAVPELFELAETKGHKYESYHRQLRKITKGKSVMKLYLRCCIYPLWMFYESGQDAS